jgi:AhpD family alkylhydroperoxidase
LWQKEWFVSGRLEYWKITPEATRQIAGVNAYLKGSAIESRLRHLVWLLTSQINGCSYCVDLHTQEALGDGERPQRLHCLVTWSETALFSAQERAALAWAEALTHISTSHAPEEVYDRVRQHFNDKDLVDLTLMIATMNAWNRMAIGFRRQPAVR